MAIEGTAAVAASGLETTQAARVEFPSSPPLSLSLLHSSLGGSARGEINYKHASVCREALQGRCDGLLLFLSDR